jgi:hypothetical protein
LLAEEDEEEDRKAVLVTRPATSRRDSILLAVFANITAAIALRITAAFTREEGCCVLLDERMYGRQTTQNAASELCPRPRLRSHFFAVWRSNFLP